MGTLIALEGIDGVGKSTLAGKLLEGVSRARPGRPVIVTHEPGATTTGTRLLYSMQHADPHFQALLMVADRLAHVEEIIQPALDVGGIVITDRYWGSTYAYQGYYATGGLVSDAWLAALHQPLRLPAPHLTLLLDMPADRAMPRARPPRVSIPQHQAYLERVRDGYLEQAIRDGWVIIDATKPADQVAEIALDVVLSQV